MVTATVTGPSATGPLAGSKTVNITAQGQEIGSVDIAGNASGVGTVVKGATLYVFGWAADTATGAPVQSVTVFVDGAGVGTATLGIARPDVANAFGRTDYANSGWSFQMSTASLSTAPHSVTATASAPSGSAQVGGTRTVTITAPTGGGQVIGSLDMAGDSNGTATVIVGGTLYVRGWAVDTASGAPVQSVTVSVDGKIIGGATLGVVRTDVAAYFGRSDYTNSGWTFVMGVGGLSTSAHTVTATAVGPSGTAQIGGGSIFTITAPTGAGQEIGSLDMVGDASGNPAVMKGQTLFVRGWAADTVGGAPVQSVTIFVDGISAGTATLGGARPDVAAYFNRTDYAASGWTFQMTTNNLSATSHSVTATAVGPSATAQLGASKTVTIQ
jgi:hypothetical protein